MEDADIELIQVIVAQGKENDRAEYQSDNHEHEANFWKGEEPRINL